MTDTNQRQCIWVFDHATHWRSEIVDRLTREGFDVESRSAYELPTTMPERPSMVVLGCAKPGKAERRLLKELVDRDIPVSIYANRLSNNDARELFHAGASDVGHRSDSSESLAQYIIKTIQSVGRRRDQPELQFTAAVL